MIPSSPTGLRSTQVPRRGAGRIKGWIGLVVVVVVLILILVNRQGLLRLAHLRRETQRLEVEIVRLQAETDSLRRERSSLERDMTYIERLARDKYRMIKKGEKVFRVVPESKDPPRPTQEAAP